MRGLIIGLGRAGRRHSNILDRLGISWDYIDPNVDKIDLNPDGFERFRGSLGDLLVQKERMNLAGFWYDFAVIATPPDLHLTQIRQCLDVGLPVLCEKPLCGLGQLAEAEALLEHPGAGRVMVGFNWRFHPEVIKLRNIPDDAGVKWTEFDFCQYRPSLPDWGLLLDHCSHDLDIFSFITKSIPAIVEAEYGETQVYKIWEIILKNGFIRDYVSNDENEPRSGQIRTYYGNGSIGIMNLQPDPAMYTAMWEAFLGGRYEPGLEEAIETQRLLERCEELAG